jgi:transposase
MSHKTLSNWVNAERKHADAVELAAAGPVDAAVYRAALHRIAELERENEFLGKVSAFFASKTQP